MDLFSASGAFCPDSIPPRNRLVMINPGHSFDMPTRGLSCDLGHRTNFLCKGPANRPRILPFLLPTLATASIAVCSCRLANPARYPVLCWKAEMQAVHKSAACSEQRSPAVSAPRFQVDRYEHKYNKINMLSRFRTAKKVVYTQPFRAERASEMAQRLLKTLQEVRISRLSIFRR